jgi:hypothetical protein
MDHFEAGGHVVVNGRQRDAQLGGEADFLLDLPDRALGDGLAVVDLALGPGPVVIARPVDQQDFKLVLDHAPWHGAGSGHGYWFPRVVCLVCYECIARQNRCP